jgi:hypothetical protein
VGVKEQHRRTRPALVPCRFDIAHGQSLDPAPSPAREIDPALARSASGATWTDVGNLFATEPEPLASVIPPLLSAAAEWLMLGGVRRIIDYHADDVHPTDYLTVLRRLGFMRLTTNERGWTAHP